MTPQQDPTLPQAPPLPTVPSVDPVLPDAVPPPADGGDPTSVERGAGGSTPMPPQPQEQPDQEGDPLVPHPEQWTITDVPADAPSETQQAPEDDQA